LSSSNARFLRARTYPD